MELSAMKIEPASYTAKMVQRSNVAGISIQKLWKPIVAEKRGTGKAAYTGKTDRQSNATMERRNGIAQASCTGKMARPSSVPTA